MTSRQVTFTVDDLPAISVSCGDLEARRATTVGMLAALTAHRIPAVGFVNESMLFGPEGLDPEQVALLRLWLDAGLELGNHTFSHLDLHQVPVEDFEQDILRGEGVMRPLLLELGRAPLRYFRHPYLHTGRDPATKHAVDAFLSRRGYRVAPVTLYTEDFWFAAAYDWAVHHRREGLANRTVRGYLTYLERTFAYCESLSARLFGHEIPQVLLLHANRLNADHLGRVAGLMAARGYEFVSLDQALRDPAYGSPDTYAGPRGIGWLQRWAWSRGLGERFLDGKPAVPRWVRLGARTPLEVELRRRIGPWREVLYQRFKKPWRARFRGAR